MAKKYISLSKLSTFLDNLKNTFAALSHTHKLSDLTDYAVDSALSSTSTNPVQNAVLDAEFDAISDAMNALDLAIDGKADSSHTHEIADVNNLQSTIDVVNDTLAQKSQVQVITSDNSEILSTLKIHRLTQEEYDQKVADGTLDENAIYLTPDEEINLSGYATIEQLNTKSDLSHIHDDIYYTETEIDVLLSNKSDSSHNHDSLYDAKGSADEALVLAKEYSNTNLATAKSYVDTGNATTLETSKTYTDNAIAQKSQVQIITWEDDD